MLHLSWDYFEDSYNVRILLKWKHYYVGKVVEGLEVPQKNLINFYLFLQLAAICDVFVENYVPGKLSEMGLGYEDIDKIAPHIIYCSITGISTPCYP